MDRERVIDELRRYFVQRPDVVAAWLFGSVARGKARADSDVDVGILFGRGPLRSLADIGPLTEIQDDLEGSLRCKVDVVPMNDAGPDLLHRILRDGVLLHESDHRRRILFEVRVRNEYWDLLPILELYRRTVLRRA